MLLELQTVGRTCLIFQVFSNFEIFVIDSFDTGGLCRMGYTWLKSFAAAAINVQGSFKLVSGQKKKKTSVHVLVLMF